MNDYNINVNYSVGQTYPETSPKHDIRVTERFTVPNTGIRGLKGRRSIGNFPVKTGTVVAISTKVNRYVGELTENRIAQRKMQIGIISTSIGLLAMKNPYSAAAVGAYYVADKAISYQIKVTKENISADFMRTLSGGTYNARG